MEKKEDYLRQYRGRCRRGHIKLIPEDHVARMECSPTTSPVHSSGQVHDRNAAAPQSPEHVVCQVYTGELPRHLNRNDSLVPNWRKNPYTPTSVSSIRSTSSSERTPSNTSRSSERGTTTSNTTTKSSCTYPKAVATSSDEESPRNIRQNEFQSSGATRSPEDEKPSESPVYFDSYRKNDEHIWQELNALRLEWINTEHTNTRKMDNIENALKDILSVVCTSGKRPPLENSSLELERVLESRTNIVETVQTEITKTVRKLEGTVSFLNLINPYDAEGLIKSSHLQRTIRKNLLGIVHDLRNITISMGKLDENCFEYFIAYAIKRNNFEIAEKIITDLPAKSTSNGRE